MSGGSYDYAYSKIEDLAMGIRHNNNPRRVAFKKLLALCAEAAHDIEWVDSGDKSPGDEDAALDAVFKALKSNPQEVYKSAAFDAIEKIILKVGP